MRDGRRARCAARHRFSPRGHLCVSGCAPALRGAPDFHTDYEEKTLIDLEPIVERAKASEYFSGARLGDDLERFLRSGGDRCVEIGRSLAGTEHLFLVGCGGSLATLQTAKWAVESQLESAARNPDATARIRDEEEDIQPAQQDRLDGEEVTGDDAGRLRAQELAPARTVAN